MPRSTNKRLLPCALGGMVFVLIILFPFQSTLHAQNDQLPELGDAATRYLSPNDEELIGKRFFSQLMARDNYIADHELRHYLNELGRRILNSNSLDDLPLQVNLVQENEINAFAVPGGHITFNSGLLLLTDNESELASVLSHEIAHLSQRHLPRLIAKSEASKLPTAAAILASILVGGQVGVAGATLANAASISSQLAYTRDFEREADAIGMELLSRSGFDTRATATFFAKLLRFNLLTQKDLPDYLRSHPLSYTRVAESEARVSVYPTVGHKSSVDFHLARARIVALYGSLQSDPRQILEERTQLSEDNERHAWRYGLALALMVDRQFDQAKEVIDEVVRHLPDVPQVLAARAEIIRMSGDPATAATELGKLISRHPDADYLLFPYVRALLEADDPAEAKKVVRRQLRRHPEYFELYPLLSRSNVALDLLAEAHQADAEFFSALGQNRAALNSLNLALRENDGRSEYLTKSIEARIEELEHALKGR